MKVLILVANKTLKHLLHCIISGKQIHILKALITSWIDRLANLTKIFNSNLAFQIFFSQVKSKYLK